MLKYISFLSLVLATASAYAAGKGHGSATDLIAPLVNVLILGTFLVAKLKKPLSDYFIRQAEEIENTLERASLKSKEAEVMLQAQTKKMANVDLESKEIIRQAENEVKNYEKIYAREIEEKATKLKADATSKIEAERKAMIVELNSKLLDEVIYKTKTSIKNNTSYQSKVSNKMFGEMLK
jgi:F0F1-type ATP synthase membrane subunit b/b'